MAQDAFSNLVASLSHATRVDHLRKIKHSIVGHHDRKEIAVKAGVITPLVKIISTQYESNGTHISNLSTEENLQLPATIVLSHLAAGGHEFVAPLVEAHADRALLHNLAHHQISLRTATLQALRNLAYSWSTGSLSDADLSAQNLNLITQDSIAVLIDLLRQPRSPHSDLHVQLVCEIVTFASATEHGDVKTLLATSELLNTLATLLVSFSVTHLHMRYQDDTSQLPQAPTPQTLPKIIAAINCIVEGSCYRTYCFVDSPSVRNLCKSCSSGEEDIHLMFNRDSSLSLASLLPQLYIPAQKSVSFHSRTDAIAAMDSNYGKWNTQIDDSEHLNAVVGWLTVFARKLRGSSRLSALRLIGTVAASIDQASAITQNTLNPQKTRERERQIAYCAVPLATHLIQDGLEARPTATEAEKKEGRQIKEQACEVLYLLTRFSKDLQTAAVDAGAIKAVCTTLRKSFESISPAKPPWSPWSQTKAAADVTCQLGEPGMPAEVAHVMRCRLGAINAIAALADTEEVHRKAVIEANVVPCLLEALKPLATTTLSNKGFSRPIEGNTAEVIYAACRAVQALSRSVAILRTSLIDAGIAKPILELLSHPSLKLRMVATDVCANLVLDFSPMREVLMELGVLDTLCEQTKSDSSQLRLSSLWALKHLILQSPIDLRIKTLDKLGAEWLMNAAEGNQNDYYGAAHGGGVALSSANAAGEQVDLLNPSSMDVDDPSEETSNDNAADYGDEDGELLYDEASRTHYQASSMRSTLHPSAFNVERQLAILKNSEQNTEDQARHDDVATQEQALDFLRNLLNGNDCAAMVEHLLARIGRQRLFGVLITKISPIPDGQRVMRSSAGTRPIYHCTDIVLASMHVITHISNGSAAHKDMVIGNRQLLEAMMPHFSHPSPRVRVMAVWTINSLTWIDNDHDKPAARRRVSELKQAGIETAIRRLINDVDVDVRERVKVAIRQLEVM